MHTNRIATCVAACALVASSLVGVAQAGQPLGVNLAPSYPDRPIPQRGEDRQQVLDTVGKPAAKQAGIGDSEVWDYGTFRVFFKGDTVAFTRVW